MECPDCAEKESIAVMDDSPEGLTVHPGHVDMFFVISIDEPDGHMVSLYQCPKCKTIKGESF